MMPGDIALLDCLPGDWRDGLFLGRVQTAEGPSPILVVAGTAYDMSRVAPTVAQLVEQLPLSPDAGEALGPLETLALPLLSPVDLQCVKACGVTFALSALERVIEEQAKGDPLRAQEIRGRLAPVLGDNLKGLEAGSEKAAEVKKLKGQSSEQIEALLGYAGEEEIIHRDNLILSD